MKENVMIREFDDQDLNSLIQLSLVAWEPVFQSFKKILGPDIFPFLYPDWKKSQKEGVEFTCHDKDGVTVLAAETENRVVGFIAYKRKGETGEVLLLGVHPDSKIKILAQR
jgi:hypothetical protein